MNKKELVFAQYESLPNGTIFTTLDFNFPITDKELKIILISEIESGKLRIVLSQVYYKVRFFTISNIHNKVLRPDVETVLNCLTQRTGMLFQTHGGVAANRLHLSTQVPVMEVFYTTGRTKDTYIGGHLVRFNRTRSLYVFQYPFEPTGWAISALYGFGPEIVDVNLLKKVKEVLKEEDYEKFWKADKSRWLARLLVELNMDIK